MVSKEDLDISVIIPFKDKAKMTLDCVKSLHQHGPGVKEILLISNNSNAHELSLIRDFVAQYSNIFVHEYNHPFNYQKVNNWAVEKSKGSFILFLNNDTELTPSSTGLIEEMYKKASQPSVGIVGCLLLYGDGRTIQHAGVFLVSGGLADHMYVGKKYVKVLQDGGNTKELPYSITEDRPMTAVTGAVNIVEKTKFVKVGGFDEKFILCGGDVDLCIRLNKAGLQTWFISDGKKYIIHKESQSRTFSPIPFNDFYQSYLSYSTAYDTEKGDPFLPKICSVNEAVVYEV